MLPLKNPQPDVKRFVDVIKGNVDWARPPLIDLKAAHSVMKVITTGLLDRQWIDYELLAFPALSHAQHGKRLGREEEQAAWDNFIAFWYSLGYDVCRLELGMYFPRRTPQPLTPQ